MLTAGTWYYPPSAGTGGWMLSNPPFNIKEPMANEIDLLPELDDDSIAEIFKLYYAGPFFETQYYCTQKIVRYAYQLGARHHAAMANSWITHRTPQRADAGPDEMVAIPAGNGSTTCLIAYNLVVPGQPWAFCNAKPGRFEP